MFKGLFSATPSPASASPAAPAGSSPASSPAAPARAITYPVKINMGCGHNKMPGYLNIDYFAGAQPDMVMDLETLPWPIPDNVATHITMHSVLEHIGQTPAQFLGIIKELWRICADGAEIDLLVPHPRHDYFLGDPTHVRPILPATLQAFDQVTNREWIATNNASTPLGLQIGVDFHIEAIEYLLDPVWKARFAAGEVNGEQVMAAAHTQNNVISDFQFKWVAHKPGRG